MSNDNAIVMYEAGQNAHPNEVLTSLDGIEFKTSFSPLSSRSGFEAVIMPNGIVNGGIATPHVDNNKVLVSAANVIMPSIPAAGSDGAFLTTATDATASRGTAALPFMITSLSINSVGTIVATAGTAGASFSESRNVAGSAPFIPVGSIEIGQIRLSSPASAVIKSTEIKQVSGLHRELSSFPVFTVDEAQGIVKFSAELPKIHTGSVGKVITASGFTPLFSELQDSSDWVPSEETHSVSSTQVYGRAIGAVSSSIGQAGFTAVLKNGHNDNILSLSGQNIWIKFKQDRNREPFQLTQGVLGVSRTFPAGDEVTATFTLSSRAKSVDY